MNDAMKISASVLVLSSFVAGMVALGRTSAPSVDVGNRSTTAPTIDPSAHARLSRTIDASSANRFDASDVNAEGVEAWAVKATYGLGSIGCHVHTSGLRFRGSLGEPWQMACVDSVIATGDPKTLDTCQLGIVCP